MDSKAPVEVATNNSLLSLHDGIWMAFAGLITVVVIISWYLMIPVCRKTFSLLVQERERGDRRPNEQKDELSVEKMYSPNCKVSAGDLRKEKKSYDIENTVMSATSGVIDVASSNPPNLSISTCTLVGVVGLIAFDSLERDWKQHRGNECETLHPFDVCSQNQKSVKSQSASFPFVQMHRATAGETAKNCLLSAPEDRSFVVLSSTTGSSTKVTKGSGISGFARSYDVQPELNSECWMNPYGIV